MLKNIGSNWTLNVVQILVFMVLSPFIVSSLGQDLNGVWVTAISLTGFLQLLILGVPMASVRYIAEHVAKGDTKRANEAVATCMAICLFMGAVVVIIGAALYPAFMGYFELEKWGHLPKGVASDASVAYWIVIATIGLGFCGRLPYGIFDAHHDFVVRNLVMGGGMLLKLGLAYVLLTRDATLTHLALVLFLSMLAEFAVALAVGKSRHAGIRFNLGAFDKSLVRGVLSFSVFAMLLNVGARLAFQTDALVIGWKMQPASTTVYDIGFKVFEPLTNLVLAIGMVVMPTATAMMARGERGQLEAILLKWTKIALSLVLPVLLYLLVLGPEFLQWWFGEEYDPQSGRLLQVLLVSYFFFLPVRGVALPLLMGLGKPQRPALALLAMGVVNLIVSIALIGPLGLLGVALGTTIPNLCFAIAVAGFACAELDVRPSTYLGYVAGRASIGLLLPLAFLLSLKYGLDVAGFWPLLASGLAFLALYGTIWVLFVYRGDRYLDPLRMITTKLKGTPDGPDMGAGTSS